MSPPVGTLLIPLAARLLVMASLIIVYTCARLSANAGASLAPVFRKENVCAVIGPVSTWVFTEEQPATARVAAKSMGYVLVFIRLRSRLSRFAVSVEHNLG